MSEKIKSTCPRTDALLNDPMKFDLRGAWWKQTMTKRLHAHAVELERELMGRSPSITPAQVERIAETVDFHFQPECMGRVEFIKHISKIIAEELAK